MTWMQRLLSLLSPRRPVEVREERTKVIDAGSWYRIGQRQDGQRGLVTGVRARVRT